MKTVKHIIVIAAVLASSSIFAQSVQSVQFDLLDRAESYCSDSTKKGTAQFNACVDEAYARGWNRYKERAQLELAQNRAHQEQIDSERRYAHEQQLTKERREAQGWALLGQAAKMSEPVRYGTNCQSRQMVQGTWTTQCF